MMKREQRKYSIKTENQVDNLYPYQLEINETELKELSFEDFEQFLPTMRIFKDFEHTDNILHLSAYIDYFAENDSKFFHMRTNLLEPWSTPFVETYDKERFEKYLLERKQHIDYLKSSEYQERLFNFIKNEELKVGTDEDIDEQYLGELYYTRDEQLWLASLNCAEEKVLEWKRIEQG